MGVDVDEARLHQATLCVDLAPAGSRHLTYMGYDPIAHCHISGAALVA